MRTSRKLFLPGILLFTACSSFLALPSLSSAATIAAFTNFGPGMSYNTSGGNAVGNAFDGNIYAEADTFQSDATGPLSTVQIALSCEFACPSSFTISLTQNASGHPGAILESF